MLKYNDQGEGSKQAQARSLNSISQLFDSVGQLSRLHRSISTCEQRNHHEHTA